MLDRALKINPNLSEAHFIKDRRRLSGQACYVDLDPAAATNILSRLV